MTFASLVVAYISFSGELFLNGNTVDFTYSSLDEFSIYLSVTSFLFPLLECAFA